MARFNLFPRGYLVSLDGGPLANVAGPVDIETVTSNPKIEVLYKLYMGRDVNPETWAFRRRVIMECSKLFGNFRNWLILQAVGNDYVYGLNLEFLRDTVQFIRTGHRNMSVLSMTELLLEHPDKHPGTAGPARLEAFDLRDTREFDNFIGMWCSHERGFDDMLCTAHTLFGVSKSPLVPFPTKL